MQGMKSTPGIKRGCGFRTKGGVYLECGLSPYGVPIEHFIMDTPHPFKVDSNIGVQIWQDPGTGVYHVIDYIGSNHYPESADFIEEGKLYGFSRKVSPTIQWEKLTSESRMLLVHKNGYLDNADEFSDGLPKDIQRGLCGRYQKHLRRRSTETIQRPDEHLQKQSIPCNAYWYVAVPAHKVYTYKGLERHTPLTFAKPKTPAEIQYATPVGIDGISYFRTVGNIEYQIHPHKNLDRGGPEDVTPDWKPALIVSLPISNISVIKANDDSHKSTYARVRGRCNMQMNVSVSEA